MPISSSNLEKARQYLEAIEQGRQFPEDLFDENTIVEQLPNRIYGNGSRATVAELKIGFKKGRELFSEQKYQINKELVIADMVVLEVLWTGKVAVSFGTLKVGDEMRAHSAMFMEFRDGKIVAQRNYDCFYAW
jgi:ketosteroid isomerase-like protein